MRRVEFQLQIQPIGKARPRLGKRGVYTPQKTVDYEAQIASAAMKAVGNQKPITGPVRLDLACVFAMPKSWTKKKRAEMLYRPHAQKPDFDNVQKAIADGGLNNIVIEDDAQIAEARYRAVWGEAPHISVIVEEL